MKNFFQMNLILVAGCFFIMMSPQAAPPIKAGTVASAAMAITAAKSSNNNSQQQQPQQQQPQQQQPQGAATAKSGAMLQTSGGLVAIPLTKMQKIVKLVLSCSYPYRCSAFAGDYCNRQCGIICAAPL